jgi:hypothetical protein
MPDKGQRAWIERVLGVAIAHKDEGARPDPRLQQIRDLAGGVAEDLVSLARADPERATGLRHAVRVALAQGEAGEPEDAAAALEEIAEFVAAIRAGQRIDMIADETTEGLVTKRVAEFEAARVTWQRSASDAAAAAQSILNQLRTETPEYAEGLETILDSYWADLDDLLEQSAVDGSTARTDQGLPAIVSEIAASAVFDELDARGCRARDALLAGIDQVRATLAM